MVVRRLHVTPTMEMDWSSTLLYFSAKSHIIPHRRRTSENRSNPISDRGVLDQESPLREIKEVKPKENEKYETP